MVRSPVVVQDLQGQCESLLSDLKLASHVMRLHQDGLKIDRPGMHPQLLRFQLVDGYLGHSLSRLPLPVFKL